MNNKQTRPIDEAANSVSSLIGRKLVLVSRTQIKTWKGALIIAFFTGTAVALILTVATSINASSGNAVTRVDVPETAAQPDFFPE